MLSSRSAESRASGLSEERLEKRAEVFRAHFPEPVVQFLLLAPGRELRVDDIHPRGARHRRPQGDNRRRRRDGDESGHLHIGHEAAGDPYPSTSVDVDGVHAREHPARQTLADDDDLVAVCAIGVVEVAASDQLYRKRAEEAG